MIIVIIIIIDRCVDEDSFFCLEAEFDISKI